jgi:N-acetylmuramic acid 6-phosphate (MurNAc-6-P) etherase
MSESSASVSEAVDVVANAPEAISNLLEYGGKLVYAAGYAAAYMIVFPAALIFAAIPKDNALVLGLVEGSTSARARAEGLLG